MNAPLSHRSCGILLHPTSLPGPSPQGTIGPEARKFIDFLHDAGQSWWQMLPIHPIGGCDSPYDSPSAFAGSELLISLTDLENIGLLDPQESGVDGEFSNTEKVDFSAGRAKHSPFLRLAFERFSGVRGDHLRPAYQNFLQEHGAWVWDYGLFVAIRNHENFRSWITWAPELRNRTESALAVAHETHQQEVLFQVFCQFIFHHQWDALRSYARQKGVQLMGDIPMFVSHDSADVWANQEMFFLDGKGERTVQAGVPPDYFCELGQLWGNPLYRWDRMQATGYGWWIDRLKRELLKFDVVRMDHFIAFSRYWEVPITAETAKEGRYVGVPGHDFLAKVREALGFLPFVAEDLGVITPQVEELRDAFELPGMKVLQFAFGRGAEQYLPHHHPPNSIAYLGTHDNDTTRGWYNSLKASFLDPTQDESEAKSAAFQMARVDGYAGIEKEEEAADALIRILLASPARTVVLTPQDLLAQGSEFRMNRPGIAEGNWTYRIPRGALTDAISAKLRAVTLATERCDD